MLDLTADTNPPSELAPIPPEEEPKPVPPMTPGHVGWHELYSSMGQEKAFAFYADQYGWTTTDQMDMGPMGTYRIFAAGGPHIGGMMDKPAEMPVSAWGFYFVVEGIDAAIERIAAIFAQMSTGRSLATRVSISAIRSPMSSAAMILALSVALVGSSTTPAEPA